MTPHPPEVLYHDPQDPGCPGMKGWGVPMLSGRARLLAAIWLYWMGLYLYVPILTPYVAQRTGSVGIAGLVVASYGVPQLLTRAALSAWSDAVRRRRPFILAGLALVALSSAGMAAWPTAAGFLVFRTLSGLAASMWAIFIIQYGVYEPAGEVRHSMGLVSFANSAGLVVAVLGGGFLAARLGDPAPFWAGAVVGVAGAGLALSLPEGDRSARIRRATPFRDALWHRDVLNASALGILYQAVSFAATFGYVPLWAHNHGLSAGRLGLLTAASLVPSAVMSVVMGSAWGRRWKLTHTLIFAFLDTAVFTATIPLQGAGLWLFLGQGLAGVGRGVATPGLMALAVRQIPEERRATSLAVYQSLYAIGMIGGPALAAVLVPRVGLSALFVAGGAVSVLAAAYAALVRLESTAPGHAEPTRTAER